MVENQNQKLKNLPLKKEADLKVQEIRKKVNKNGSIKIIRF